MFNRNKKATKLCLQEDSNTSVAIKNKRKNDFINQTGKILENEIPNLTQKGINGLNDYLDSKGIDNDKIKAETQKIYSEIESHKIEELKKWQELEAFKLKNEKEKLKVNSLKLLVDYLQQQNIHFYIDKDDNVIVFDGR